MNSLAYFVPVMAKTLGRTSPVLWERQKVLAKRPGAVLEAVAGRGPGSGVRLTARAVAVLLISAMASETVAGAVTLTKIFTALAPEDGKCSLTGAKTLVDAITKVIASPKFEASDFEIWPERKKAVLRHAAKGRSTVFLDRPPAQPTMNLHKVVILPGEGLRQLSKEFLKKSVPEELFK